jgi:hypothetical protein
MSKEKLQKSGQNYMKKLNKKSVWVSITFSEATGRLGHVVSMHYIHIN